MKISVVMPTRNSNEFINHAIDSILKQTLNDFEFIIIDDNSTDGTLQTIENYKDNRIKLIKGDGKGLAAALNKGILAASGDYIARMDADDYSYPNRFEKQAAFLDNNADYGLVGTFAEFNTDDIRFKDILFCDGAKSFSKPGLIDVILNTPACHPTVMFRKAFFIENGLLYNESFKATEDQELFFRAMLKTKFYNIPEVLFSYRYTSTNATETNRTIGDINLEKVKRDMLERLHPTGDYKTLNQVHSKFAVIQEILDSPDVLPDNLCESYVNSLSFSQLFRLARKKLFRK